MCVWLRAAVLVAMVCVAGPPALASGNGAAARGEMERGLLLYHAYNGPASTLAFQRAALAAPADPMPYWGIALAQGPNLNYPFVAAQFSVGKRAIERAARLEGKTPARDRALVEAMRLRYAGEFQDIDAGEARYVRAMTRLARRYSNDDEIVLLHAESLLEHIHGPALWQERNSAQRREIASAIARVLRRNPASPMANHLFIHLHDGDPAHGGGTASAERLVRLDVEPDAEHLVHMAAHAFVEHGLYARAVRASARALDLDARTKSHLYRQHDYQIGLGAAFNGPRYVDGRRFIRGHCPLERPACEDQLLALQTRFLRWHDVLRATASATNEFRRMLHARALLELGRTSEAEYLVDDLARSNPALRSDANATNIEFLVRKGRYPQALALARRLAEGERQDMPELAPEFPGRETLGHVYYSMGRYDAAAAVFATELRSRPGGGRALYGLWQALLKMHVPRRAANAKRAFGRAWAGSDTPLAMNDL